MQTGVWARGSIATVMNNRFFEMVGQRTGVRADWSGIAFPLVYPDIRVGELVTNPHDPFNFSNVFEGCNPAVFVNGYGMVNVANNAILTNNFSERGIHIQNSASGFPIALGIPINVMHNNILGGIGIFIHNSSLGNKFVHNNRVSYNLQFPGAFGIRVENNFLPGPIFLPGNQNMPVTEITENVVSNLIFSHGISSIRNERQRIVDNTISFITGGGLGFGIYIEHSPASWVRCNRVFGTHNTTDRQQLGIVANTSAGSWITRNRPLQNLGRGINCIGQMAAGTVIATNLMSNCNVGFALDNQGDVGRQGIPPGITYDNQWEATGTFQFADHLRSYSGSNANQTTEFLLRTVNPPGPGSLYYPDGFSSDDDGSGALLMDFVGVASTHASFVDNPLFEGCINTDVIPSMEDPGYIAELLKVVKDEISYPDDSLTYRWWARYNLYHALVNRSWLAEANDTLQDFIDEFKTTPTARLEYLGSRTALMSPQFNTSEDFTYLEGQINRISVTHDIDAIMKLFMKIYLKYVKDTFNFSSVQLTLDSIAHLCVFYNGPSVLVARQMLTNDNLDYVNYDWGDSLCSSSSSSKTDLQPKPKKPQFDADYRLHPNLLKGILTARITLKENEHGYVEVFSMQGKRMGTYTVTEGNNMLDLGNIRSGSGIYFYRVWVNGEFKNSDKLVILQ